MASLNGNRFLVYDSMYKSLHEQTKKLVHLQTGQCHDTVMVGTQRQTGAQDCGLFAIAFVISIAFAQDPGKMTYNQSKMREHSIKCLNKKAIQVFT